MYFTGFADEASSDIREQVRATRELGWKYIEARNIDGCNIHDLPEDKFEEVCAVLTEGGISINCFGSAVANWAKRPDSEEDFRKSVEELRRAIPRMQKLGTKMIRGMSFVILKDQQPDSPELEKEIFRKVQYLVDMCDDAGIAYLHENCRNYGGLSYKHTLKLLDNIKSPSFKLIFDTGNPVFSADYVHPEPRPYQCAWEFYRNVREFIAYIHIKDAVMEFDPEKGEDVTRYTFAGEGCGDVRAILKDAFKYGYDGGISIEPHIGGVVFHEQNNNLPEADVRFRNYVEYGRRMEKLVADVRS